MKKIFSKASCRAFSLILCIVGISFAQTSTTTTIGNTTYTYNSDGSTTTQQRVGNNIYTYGSNGSSSTTTTVGNTSYTYQNNPPTQTVNPIAPIMPFKPLQLDNNRR